MSAAYVLYAPDGSVLYAGSSRNVERRVREHRREWGAEVAFVETFPTETWAEALRLEKCLIGDLNPTHNRQSLDPIEQAQTLDEFAAALGVAA